MYYLKTEERMKKKLETDVRFLFLLRNDLTKSLINYVTKHTEAVRHFYMFLLLCLSPNFLETIFYIILLLGQLDDTYNNRPKTYILRCVDCFSSVN